MVELSAYKFEACIAVLEIWEAENYLRLSLKIFVVQDTTKFESCSTLQF